MICICRRTSIAEMEARLRPGMSGDLGWSIGSGMKQLALRRRLRIIIAGLCLSTVLVQSAPPAAKASISGRVSDVGTGSPVVGIEILYRLTGGPPEASRVTTDAEGRFHIPNLAAGQYGFFGASSTSGYSSSSRLVTLAEGEELKGVDFQVTRSAVLAGRVVDPQKRPLQGASVQARSLWYQNGRLASSVRRAVTNDLGEYRLANLPPGPYHLMVERKPLRIQKRISTGNKEETAPEPVLALSRTWYPNSPEYEGAVAIQLAPGEQREGLDIALIREMTTCVRVRLTDTAGAADARIHAQVVEDVPGGMSTTADGILRAGDDAEVCGIPPGSYHFRAVTQDGAGQPRYGAAPLLVTRQPVRLPDLLLQALPDLRANLKLDGGGENPRLPAPVLVSTSVSDFGTIVLSGGATRVRELGPFVIPAVRPEKLWLDVALPPGAYLKAANINGVDAMRQSFHAAEGELELVLGLDGPVVSGEVVDKQGKPVSDALAALGLDALPSSPSSKELSLVQADQQGRFTFTGMAPGKYRLLVMTGSNPERAYHAYFRANRLNGELLTLSANEKRSVRCVLKD